MYKLYNTCTCVYAYIPEFHSAEGSKGDRTGSEILLSLLINDTLYTINTYVCMYVHTEYVHTYVRTYIRTYMYVCTYICICMYLSMHNVHSTVLHL